MQNLILIAAGLIMLVIITMHSLGESEVVRAGPAPPTPAPTATPGTPTKSQSVYPTLEHPLSKEEAIQKALEYDKRIALWLTPWSLDTLLQEPERITVNSYPDRSYDGSEYGEDAENGPLWVVTIKGKVQLIGWDPTGRFHDGISYQISQKTGDVLGFRSGPWN